jgi:FlaA1/EpsC-like NDP-sugar epimerase
VFFKYGRKSAANKENSIIIFGAGEAGKFLANMLAYDRSKNKKIVAFIDDNPELHGRRIKGYPVAGGRNIVSDAVRKYKADEIIIAIPHVDNSNFRQIVELCCASGCRVRRFANMSDLNMTDLSKATITDINIEDLLGRAPVKLDMKGVGKMLSGRVVLVTGGAGSIGSEICRQVLSFDVEKVVIYDANENELFKIGLELNEKHGGRFEMVIGNIKDRSRLDEIMGQYRPQIVFHAAAYKHVPMMELNPMEAVGNNVMGTYHVMHSAAAYGVERFALISTDKAVNPTSVMGATKRIAELLCKSMSDLSKTTKFSAVRFGNVLGSNGSVITVFKEQIRKGGPITVTDREIQRYFMTIPEAVQLVMEASSISKGGELFVLDMGEMIKIYDLALTMIRLSGLEPEKDIKIEISGLRPGEKLYEELQMHTESLIKTANDRIFFFKADQIRQEEFQTQFDRLSAAFDHRDLAMLLRQMKRLVPTYSESAYVLGTYKHNDPDEDTNDKRQAD